MISWLQYQMMSHVEYSTTTLFMDKELMTIERSDSLCPNELFLLTSHDFLTENEGWVSSSWILFHGKRFAKRDFYVLHTSFADQTWRGSALQHEKSHEVQD